MPEYLRDAEPLHKRRRRQTGEKKKAATPKKKGEEDLPTSPSAAFFLASWTLEK